jgi:cell division transport system permease protein
MLGLVALLFFSGKKMADQFKENIEFTVIMKDNATEKEILAVKEKLQNEQWVKSATYVSKEEAARIFMTDHEENLEEILDYNPLFASINLKLNAGFTSEDSIAAIEKRVLAYSEAGEFYYEKKLVSVLNDNFRKISLVLLGFGFLLLLIAITLIDSTIRLSMYSNRFLIRSMQLVGATRQFVTWPFVKRGLYNGIIAAVISIFFLMLLLNFAIRQVPELGLLSDWKFTLFLFLFMLLAGILFSYVSTRLAVRKYLRMPLDDLY